MNSIAEKQFSRFASLKLRRLSLRRPASGVADSRLPVIVDGRKAQDSATMHALVSLPLNSTR